VDAGSNNAPNNSGDNNDAGVNNVEPDVKDDPTEDIEEPPDGQVGDPCDTDDDCALGLCIQIADGRKLCTQYCGDEDDCPQEFDCTLIENSGADAVFLCAPEANQLCRPCRDDDECGGLSDLCVGYTTGSSFCGRDCSSSDCPEGFDCVQVDGANGASFQCVDQATQCCRPTNDGVEICDLLDNDCDGVTDEGFDLDNDTNHCGACGRACALPRASAQCAMGQCLVNTCEDGFYDINTDPNDGCEYECDERGAEECNERDDDCDGMIDEDFDLTRDVQNCGACDRECRVSSGVAACVDSACAVEQCEPGFADCDGDPAACETPTAFNPENCGACDYRCDRDWPGRINALGQCVGGECQRVACVSGYDDCNGFAEDGCETDLRTSTDHCLFCGNSCNFPNAIGQCSVQGCQFVACAPGYYDLDNDPDNGCEYRCGFYFDNGGELLASDEPDDTFTDTNCDGVDGDIERAVFVRQDGSDAYNGLSPGQAVASLERAFAILNDPIVGPNRDQVLLATGTYRYSAPVVLRSGASLYGGYTPNFAGRNDTQSSLQSSGETAVVADGLTAPVVLDRLSISVDNRTGESQPAVTLKVRNSGTHLWLRHTTVVAGRGGNGASGSNGNDGRNGDPGGDASGAGAGGGGFPGGGSGASGRSQGAGPGGSNGDANGSACGGGGGGGSGGDGLGCGDGDPRNGGNGGRGCDGGAGGDAGGGSGQGALQGLAWFPSRGGDGSPGGAGGGGGGAGAGGGEDCESCPCFGGCCFCIYCGTGRGGGGGGGGGGAGSAGTGGTGGGASIGLLVEGSMVTMEEATVRTLGGGSGGAGGRGGAGGGGAPGGSGANDSDNTTGEGGDGGPGGNGGRGGHGGGGGGGPSVGVWGVSGAAVVRLGDVAVDPGPGGLGGVSNASYGQNGIQEAFKDIEVR
jgi:hypothetical protein